MRPWNVMPLVLATAIACHRQQAVPVVVQPDFALLGSTVTGPLTLDAPIDLIANAAIDPASIASAGLRLTAADRGRTPPPTGTFAVVAAGERPGHGLRFLPRLPTGTEAAATGLRPGCEYVLVVPRGGLASTDGRRLGSTFTLRFGTVAGTIPGELFSRRSPGGPRIVEVNATPRDAAGRWQLGRFAQGGAELRVVFDRPLDPSPENLPRTSAHATTSALWLTYDDPQYGVGTLLPADLELERNAHDGATVLLRPRGVLPSAADIWLHTAGGLRDLAGEPAIVAVAQRAVRTEDALAAQSTTWRETFDDPQILDDTADFVEPAATIGGGMLRAGPVFPVGQALGDWQADSIETQIDTRRQDLRLTNGQLVTFRGGVIVVRNLTIPASTFVRGFGPNPLTFVVEGDATIDGVLTVNGFPGARTFQFPNYRGPGDARPGEPGFVPPTIAGGRGNCGGGNGGRSGHLTPGHTVRGENGHAAGGVADGGGGAGLWICDTVCTRGSAAGGGSFATQGDPDVLAGATPEVFPQQRGVGGQGCTGAAGAASRILPGGVAGPLAMLDSRADNDHFGVAWNPRTRQRIRGELRAPRGGSGGGGGGNLGALCEPGQAFPGVFDSAGGAGGGGGGVLVLQVRGRLRLGPSGRISADGGHGTGGAPRSTSLDAGGGGGGSGGMVVLAAGAGIELHAHGGTFADRNYDFAISADGGVCTTSSFGAREITGKYPANGTAMLNGTLYNELPLGGFGGLGVIQLMVPPGTDNADQTNTVLDDRIDVFANGMPQTGAAKQRILGWRGFPDAHGTRVDDFGQPTAVGVGSGDLRPAPILMPLPWGATSRARSRWLPLGEVARRTLTQPDGQPRGVIPGATPIGPDFTLPTPADGWLPWQPFGVGVIPAWSSMLPAALAISSLDVAGGAAGRPTHTVTLREPLTGGAPDRYTGTLAELFEDTQNPVATFRVVGNDDRTLSLMADRPLPERATRVRIVAATADLPAEPVGTYRGADGQPVPRGNARIGFAFHRDPEQALSHGNDPLRFPTTVGEFVRDLGEPTTMAALRAFGATHLSFEVQFDQQFRRSSRDQPPPPDPLAPFHLRGLWLPFRF